MDSIVNVCGPLVIQVMTLLLIEYTYHLIRKFRPHAISYIFLGENFLLCNMGRKES